MEYEKNEIELANVENEEENKDEKKWKEKRI